MNARLPAIASLFLLVLASGAAQADAVTDLLAQYQKQGGTNFSIASGLAFWSSGHIDAKSGETRRCSTCHSEDLRRTGKHATTGKLIEPLAPSANPERLTDVEKIEKWLARNCKWVLSRECTPQEKGDVLVMIKSK
jgi:Domain of unknown function (DUF1924)